MKRCVLLHLLAHSALATVIFTLTGCSSDATGNDDPSPQTDDAAERSVQDDALGPDFLRAPVGGIHRSCVHELEDGDSVDEQGAIHSADGRVQPVGACGFAVKRAATSMPDSADAVAPTDNGWTEDANWTSPASLKLFSAQFHVPAAPHSYTGQTIFLFPALEDTAGTAIIQPVLQYGPSGAGGGNYWAIASWFGGAPWGNHYYHTGLRRVSTGEVISGSMYNTGKCHPPVCSWGISMHDSKNTSNLTIYADSRLSWRWIFGGTVEVYGINSCAKYPATYDNFFNFLIEDLSGRRYSAAWRHDIHVHTCGERITSNAGLVNLYY
ncbi:MAG TPA: hypothetical protein VNO21_23225 [Polyangiaceae bacterium]|nr:hypothetical protein [Polyangiaceae bacterium]